VVRGGFSKKKPITVELFLTKIQLRPREKSFNIANHLNPFFCVFLCVFTNLHCKIIKTHKITLQADRSIKYRQYINNKMGPSFHNFNFSQ
jgi:hypothetical protein